MEPASYKSDYMENSSNNFDIAAPLFHMKLVFYHSQY